MVCWRLSREREREGERPSESESSSEDDSDVDDSMAEVLESRGDGAAGGRAARGGLGGGVTELIEFATDVGRGSG